jgi:signal transduction histidine kinase/CheY-like chemotaxis protein
MKTLLVLAAHPELAEILRTGLNPDAYRVLHRAAPEDAEPLLAKGLADACVLDLDLTGVQGLWFIEKIRRGAPRVPVIVFTSARQSEWEEEAYLKGVAQVLLKPVRPRLLSAILARLWPAEELPLPARAVAAGSAPPVHPVLAQSGPTSLEPSAYAIHAQGMGLLRSFSGILTHSLDADAMLRQFLLQLREILSINRGAVFLRHGQGSFSGGLNPDSRRLRAAGSIGIAPGLLEHLELSLDSGIGGHIFRLGRVVRRTGEETRADVEAQKEFDLLGAQVAVPILDRHTVLGVAIFDGRITGEPLLNTELELIFHLLEQVGMAVRNIWMHDQLAANHEMLAGILRELSSACIVVGRDLAVLHANKAARRIFTRQDRRGGELEFTDLPPVLGTRVYQVLKTGAAVGNYRFEPEETPGAVFNVSIVPFQSQPAGLPNSALLIVEDLSQVEQLRRLELEAADLRLVRKMADRLSAEIGNAMVPISAHQQLLGERGKDPEFQKTLGSALADGVKRVSRLINTMRFLTRDSLISEEQIPVTALIDEAYQEACKFQPEKAPRLRYDKPDKAMVLTGDRAALKHAFTEVFINALQANPTEPKVGVRLNAAANGNGKPGLQVEIQDNGAGFTPETAKDASLPFFTTRIVGVGLGLTVSRKIIETHRGKLEILPAKTGESGLVRIVLPLESAPA